MGRRIVAGPGCGVLKFGTEAGRGALAEADAVIDYDAIGRAVDPDADYWVSPSGAQYKEVRAAADPEKVQRFTFALRKAAISIAAGMDLDFVVTTSGGPERVAELAELAGGAEVVNVELSRDEAIKRLRRLVGPDRLAECIEGVDRWYASREAREAGLPHVELREVNGVKHLHGVMLQEGRAAAGGRRELFAPGAVTWPAEGVAILTEHRGRPEVRTTPTREANGEIRIAAPATPAIVAAVQSGKRSMSVEFRALTETTTASGVREIERAVVNAAALTTRPEYGQTSAEIRRKRVDRVWL